MTDRDVIERLQAVVGAGRVYVRPLMPGQTKPMWWWMLNEYHAARNLMTSILPLMGERRAARIREVLTVTERSPR